MICFVPPINNIFIMLYAYINMLSRIINTNGCFYIFIVKNMC